MDHINAIKAILAEGSAKDMQANNADEKKDQTKSPSTKVDSSTHDALKAPGYDSVKTASHATGKATAPQDDPKAKSSSSKNVPSGQPSGGSKEVTTEEGEGEDKGGSESFAARMKKLRDMKKKGSDDSEDKSDDSDDSDDSEDSDDSDDSSNDSKKEKKEKDMEEHFQALFNGETLTEDFKNRAKAVFEAAIQEKTSEIRSELAEEFEQTIAEEVEKVQIELAEKLDEYLNYLAEKWMEENRLVVENGIRTEIAESLLEGLRGLFLQHNITVPEGQVDLVNELNARVEELESNLNEELQENIELNEQLNSYVKDQIVFEHGENLSDTQFDRFAKLCENVSFENEDDFNGKIKNIRESYFGPNAKKSDSKVISENKNVDINDEPDNSSNTSEDASPSAAMEEYSKALSRMGKK